MITHLFISPVISFLSRGSLNLSNLDYELCDLAASARWKPSRSSCWNTSNSPDCTDRALSAGSTSEALIHIPSIHPALTYFGRTSNRRPPVSTTSVQAPYHGRATLATVNIGFFGAIYEETPRIQGRSFNLKPNPRAKAVVVTRTFHGMFSNPVNPFKEYRISLFGRESSRVFAEKILGSCSCKYDEIPCYFASPF